MVSKLNPIRIVKHTEYPGMYWLQWSDGRLSTDFYNKTRAEAYLRDYQYYLKQASIPPPPLDL